MTASLPTDCLLLKAHAGRPAARAAAARLKAWLAAQATPAQLQQAAHAAEPGRFYAYVRFARREMLDAAGLAAWTAQLAGLDDTWTGVQVSRMQVMLDLPGHSHDAAPRHHYVVETDADEGWMPEIARWYDEEHLPGLAQVPGCTRAIRMVNHDHAPQSLACYDLVAPEVMGSPPWLAFRNTPWSDRTRPHFANPLRTMFDRVGAD